MTVWLDRRENAAGEWTVFDRRRNYRLCDYNHARHGGPHLHPPRGPARTVEVPTAAAAERIMRRYAVSHQEYDERGFMQEVKRWKSESRNG